MSFWNKKPPEGETDEQRKAREEKEEQDFLAKIGLTVESKMKPLSDKVMALDDRWKKLEDAASATDEININNENLTEEEKRENTRKIENAKLLAVTIATNARMTESEVIGEVKDKFPDFVAKIKEIFAATPLERKSQADYGTYCRNVVKMVVGDAAMSGGLQYDAAKKSFWLEDASSSSNGETHDFLAADMTWVDPKSGRTMSGREQLARLGIKPEEFAESVKKGVV